MVGKVPVGGDSPITVQSMTTTKTADVEATLAQIYALAANGADIVRCTCNEVEAAEALARIVPRSPVPIVADIHFQYKLALAALEAGVHCLRLNPGNIRKPEHIRTVVRESRDRGVPIRIGVNGGSLDPDIEAEQTHIARFNGQRALFVSIKQKDRADAGTLKRALVAAVDEFRPDLPPDIRIEVGFDQSNDISRRLNELARDFAIALALSLPSLRLCVSALKIS